jgi:hypothetical protein
MNRKLAAGALRRPCAALLCVAIVLSGCSTASSGIATAYVSPLQFQGYDCQQIAAEMQRIHVRVNQLAGRLDKAAENDKALVGVGMILFWPALFALGGTKEQEAEYARLKGEYEALERVANEKRCNLTKDAAGVPSAASATSAPAAASAASAVAQ